MGKDQAETPEAEAEFTAEETGDIEAGFTTIDAGAEATGKGGKESVGRQATRDQWEKRKEAIMDMDLGEMAELIMEKMGIGINTKVIKRRKDSGDKMETRRMGLLLMAEVTRDLVLLIQVDQTQAETLEKMQAITSTNWESTLKTMR